MTNQEDYSSCKVPVAWDYYYSKTMAAQDNYLCHTIDGKPYTEAVGHGRKPISNVTDNVLVASNVPDDEEKYRAHYNVDLMKRISRQMHWMG